MYLIWLSVIDLFIIDLIYLIWGSKVDLLIIDLPVPDLQPVSWVCAFVLKSVAVHVRVHI